MCKLMEDYGEKIIKRSKMEIALNLWNSGIRDLQQIASVTNLSIDEVKELIEKSSM